MKVLSVIAAVMDTILRVVIAVAVVYLIYRGAGICYDYGYRIFTEEAVATGEGRTVTVTITEDMSALEIGKLFESRGLVRDAKLFVLQYYLSEYVKDVKPGTFELSTAMTAEEMMEAMADLEDEESEEGTMPQGGNASQEGSSEGGASVPAGGASPEEESGEETEDGE